jgi:hypothetical protein
VALNQGGRPAEVINAGVAAYGTGQELLLLDKEGAKYEPDLVLLLFFVGNDVANNNYKLELWDGNLKLALKPYFNLEKDGSLRLIPVRRRIRPATSPNACATAACSTTSSRRAS